MPAGYDSYVYPKNYAVVALCNRPGEHSAEFTLPTADEADKLVAVGTEVRIAGHPAEESAEGETKGARLYHQKGLSEAPVWIERAGRYVLVGIHVAEGKVRHLDQDAVEKIEQWKLTTRQACPAGP